MPKSRLSLEPHECGWCRQIARGDVDRFRVDRVGKVAADGKMPCPGHWTERNGRVGTTCGRADGLTTLNHQVRRTLGRNNLETTLSGVTGKVPDGPLK